MLRILSFILSVISVTPSLTAQDHLSIPNPSFEERLPSNALPMQWNACYDAYGGQVDLLSETSVRNSTNSEDKDHFVGLALHRHGTSGALSVRLERPMNRRENYYFSVTLSPASLQDIQRLGRPGDRPVAPVVFQVWGGTDYCDHWELLGRSDPLTEYGWATYVFEFSPDGDWSYLTIEATWPEGTNVPTEGYLLVDDLRTVFNPDFANANRGSLLYNTVVTDSTSFQLIDTMLYDFARISGYSPALSTEFKLPAMHRQLEADLRLLGVRQLLIQRSPTTVKQQLRVLERMGSKDVLKLLRSAARVYYMDETERTVEDRERFEQSDDRLRRLLNTGGMTNTRLAFIAKNQRKLLDEIVRLQIEIALE